MTRGHQIEFANFILHSGDKEMLDILNNILWPALTSGNTRTHGTTTFLIDQPQVASFSHNNKQYTTLIGRIIKNIKLQREQYLNSNNELISNDETLDSAPSSIFVLTLDNHKLAYLHETKFAPPLNQFTATLSSLIKKQHALLINNQFRERTNPKTTRTQLLKSTPIPTLDIIPFTMSDSIGSFIETLDTIKSIRTQLIKPNNEIDLNPIFQGIRKEGENLGALKTTISQTNPQGLNPQATKSYVDTAAKQGNSLVEVKGVDKDGNELRGDNHRFSLKHFLPSLPPTLKARAKAIFDQLKHLGDTGAIPATSPLSTGDSRITEFTKNINQQTNAVPRTLNGR